MAYISRSMTSTERRYAQIEKEALAFTWACERLSDYLTGLKFQIETDHKPLVPLFSTKNLEELPLRVQRFRLRMMRFSFTITHVPGKELVIANTLSRAPAGEATQAENLLEEESRAYVNLVLESIPATEQRLEEIRRHQELDKISQAITEFCQTGWPKAKQLSPEMRKYFPMAAEFTVENNLLLRGNRIVIPPPLRQSLLSHIHDGHQGITKCRERARNSVWWPGVSRDIEHLVNRCETCTKAQIQHAQPLIPSPLPELPWQRVATDLFQWKERTYLLLADYYSRYIEIAKLDRTMTAEVIRRMKSIFARHGIPEVVVSDNGPQYSSQAFREFTKDYQFRHETSSPYYPQGNGEAERAVKTVKGLLNKSDDPYKALLAYRTTPTRTGFSPCELLMGRLLRSTVPTTKPQRQPRYIDPVAMQMKDTVNKERQKRNFGARRGVRNLPHLQPGDPVWLLDKQVNGEVNTEVAPQSFTIDSDEGTYRRNRKDIIRLPDPQQHNRSEETTPTTSASLRRSNRISEPPERLDPSWTH